MAGFLSALGRGNQQKDPMRESAALTTVYLLEQNQKFEQFMRQKVDEMEVRVAAQQARLSTREETDERELWAALESFEAPPVTTRTAEEVEVDDIIVEATPEPEDESMEWNEYLAIEETSNARSTDEPEEIPDYLALMSGAVTEPAAQIGIESPIANELPEADIIEFNDPHPAASIEEASPVIEPKNEPSSTIANDPPQDVPIAPQNDSSPFSEAVTELPADNIENDNWPGQPYEMFQVNRPAADAIEEIWPELALADEVELLGRQPGDDEVAGVEKTPVSPATKTTESDATSAKIANETEQTWQTTLSDGQKREWT